MHTFFSVDASAEVDCGPRLGLLANHGAKTQRNAVMKVIECDSSVTLCLFSTTFITAGQEILYDYGVKVPWEVWLYFHYVSL